MDTIMAWVSLGVLAWLAGAGMHYWPGPVRASSGLMTRLMSRHCPRRSAAGDMSCREDLPDVMTSGGGADDVEPLDPAGILTRSTPTARTIRLDTRYLPVGSHALPLDGDDDELPDRRTWVARQVEQGRRPGDIDDEGARLYGVTSRTIARDRMALARRHSTAEGASRR